MNNDIALHEVSIEEKEVLQEICRHVYAINFGNHWTGQGLSKYLKNQFGDEALNRDLDNPRVLYYFITFKSKKVGFLKIKLFVSSTVKTTDHCAEIEKLYILPEFKGRGIGRYSIERSVEILQSKGMEELILCVLDSNSDAIAFYKKLGFEICGTQLLEAASFKEELRGMFLMKKTLLNNVTL